MSGHTKEPWQVGHTVAGSDETFNPNRIYAAEHHNNSGAYGIADVLGVALHQTLDRVETDPLSEEGLANARRIVNCVNACAGVENPESTVPKLAESNRRLSEALKAAAAKLSEVRDGTDFECECWEVAEIARDALAEAGGGDNG